ncbi:MAG: hypothetical protein M3O70_22265 [Actinomycetota bacterium]|nr:hypothetical protein [Actinomycetota bacterium]
MRAPVVVGRVPNPFVALRDTEIGEREHRVVLTVLGPNGPNNFGLCTTYFAESEKGTPGPPFQALEEVAEAPEQSVEEWCAENAPHPSGNGED